MFVRFKVLYADRGKKCLNYTRTTKLRAKNFCVCSTIRFLLTTYIETIENRVVDKHEELSAFGHPVRTS